MKMIPLTLLMKRTLFFTNGTYLISDELQIDNDDQNNLCVFEEHMASDEDNQATQEELLQQENFTKMQIYDPKEKVIVSSLPVMNHASPKGDNYTRANLYNQQFLKAIPKISKKRHLN